ncbi:rod shape-determining protein MreD [Streptococcus ovuberis]|uniref:Rod shape-determining protein MreD n=1 Tax=Streptococcus ovuberis TaxID=1936207 RepID=A0A7X6S244_9STRE|nr:rod shape-determining protein MreD [Streptococcus ovuberis]NKZ21452.1 rod shape-determining protein MreD [Streptococcus ovuberis]
MKRVLFLFLLLVGLIFLDLQLGSLLSPFLENGIQPNYHIFLVVLVALTSGEYDWALFYACLLIGAFWDIYILNVLGLNIILLPIFTLLASGVYKIKRFSFWRFCFLSVIFIFLFETSHFGVAQFLGWMSYSWDYFTVKILAPTLVVNLVVGVLLYPLFKRFLQRNRHLIVTNV